MVWEGQMGKGKGRMVVDGEQEEEVGMVSLVSSTKERGELRVVALFINWRARLDTSSRLRCLRRPVHVY